MELSFVNFMLSQIIYSDGLRAQRREAHVLLHTSTIISYSDLVLAVSKTVEPSEILTFWLDLLRFMISK